MDQSCLGQLRHNFPNLKNIPHHHQRPKSRIQYRPLADKYKTNMNTPTPWLVEVLFLFSSSISIFHRTLAAVPLLAFIYLLFLFAYAIGCFKLRPPNPIMFHSPLCIVNLFIFCTLLLSSFANAQNATSTTTSFRPIFTVPASADVGMYL